MKPFDHINAKSIDEAFHYLDATGENKIIAGGTDILSEMKRGIILPRALINIKDIPNLQGIEKNGRSGIRIGALTTLHDLEQNEIIREKAAILAQAAADTASPQLRHMATLGGALCQRPRCWYYRSNFWCLKKGGETCYAVNGDNRYHAILGGGRCYIVHPSDVAVALMALGAILLIRKPDGEKWISIDDFFILPRTNIHRENIISPRDIVTAIAIPEQPPGSRGIFIKAMDRQAWSFALGSIAVQAVVDSGRCRSARIVLGGVAPIPWRARSAEQSVVDSKLTATDRLHAAKAAVEYAQPMKHNAYKIPLARNLATEALTHII